MIGMKSMTKSHKWAEVIKAWADGKPIQSRHVSSAFGTLSHPWMDFLHESVPDFNNNDIEWRIKREPELKILCRVALLKYPETNINYVRVVSYAIEDLQQFPIDLKFDWNYTPLVYADSFVRWVTEPIYIFSEE